MTEARHRSKKELLEYYWRGEPIYDQEHGRAMPRASLLQARMRAILLLAVYVGLSAYLVSMAAVAPFVWIISIFAGAYLADLLSGIAHIYIDFGVSNRKNPIHKALFLSRVHHHERYRPAKLNYASLWVGPALSSISVVVLIPAVLVGVLPIRLPVEILAPFILSLLWFSSISQISHAFAHGKAKNPVAKKLVRLLQKAHLLLPPSKHGKHHREIDCNFSVLNGWSIPLLNGVFRRCIAARLSPTTTPARQRKDMKLGLSYPYEEIL